MTRFGALLSTILVLVSYQADAATRVQSGDHIGFVRLVVYFDRGQQWSLDKTEGGYSLQAQGLGEGYDVSSVFEMIQPDRITAVSSTEDNLVIELACECVATTTELTGGQLVIDFADPSPETSRADAPIEDKGEPDPKTVLPDQTADVERNAEQQSIATLQPVELPDVLEPPTLDVGLGLNQDRPTASGEELAEFRRKLLENLGRSASLSLVDLAETPSDPTNIEQRPPLQLSTGITSPDRTRVSNAVDDALDPRSGDVKPIRRRSCPSSKQFDIGDWGSEDGFSTQISDIRRSLLGEFDEVDADQVVALARSYLHYGLTDEARHVLSQFDVAPVEADALSRLSHLIDNTPADSPHSFSTLDHCGGSIIPWRLLEQPRTASINQEQRQQIAAEFSKWPKSLQERLGPRLIEILDARGFETTASFINAIIGDGRPAIKTELAGMSAPIGVIREEVEEGDPEALADLLRREIDDGSEIGERYLELASAFEKETAGTELSERLHNLRVEAHAYRDDVAGWIELVKRNMDERNYSTSVLTKSASHVVAKSGSAETAVFSTFLLRSGLIALVSDDIVYQIADQLVKASLPNLAKEVLETRTEPTVPVTLEVRLASSERQTDRLAGLISDIPDPIERDRSANEILNVSGVGSLPSGLLEDLSQETRDRVAWAGSDWENVTSDGPEGNISKLIIEVENLELGDTPLTTAKEIRGKAAETRELLSELLEPQQQ